MPTINNQASDNAYTVASELTFSPRGQVTTIVSNAAVFLQFALAPEGQTYARGGAYAYQGEEKYCVPNNYVWGPEDFNGLQIAGVRFRSAVTDTPGRVSIFA